MTKYVYSIIGGVFNNLRILFDLLFGVSFNFERRKYNHTPSLFVVEVVE